MKLYFISLVFYFSLVTSHYHSYWYFTLKNDYQLLFFITKILSLYAPRFNAISVDWSILKTIMNLDFLNNVRSIIGNLSFGSAPNDNIFQYKCICLKVLLLLLLCKGFFFIT